MLLNVIALAQAKNPPFFDGPKLIGPVPGANLGPRVEGLSKIEPPVVKLKPLPLGERDVFEDEEKRRMINEMMNQPGNHMSMLYDEVNQRKVLDQYKMQQIELLNLRDEAEIIKAAELMGVLPGTVRNLQMIAEDAAGVTNNIQEQILERRAERTLEMAQNVMRHPDIMARHQMRRILGMPDETPEYIQDQTRILADIREAIERPIMIPEGHSEVANAIAREMGGHEEPLVKVPVYAEEIATIADTMRGEDRSKNLPKMPLEFDAIVEEEGGRIQEIAAQIRGEVDPEPAFAEIPATAVDRMGAEAAFRMIVDSGVKLPQRLTGEKKEAYRSAQNQKNYEQNIRAVAAQIDNDFYARNFDIPVDELLARNDAPAARVKLLARMVNVLNNQAHGKY